MVSAVARLLLSGPKDALSFAIASLHSTSASGYLHHALLSTPFWLNSDSEDIISFQI